LHSSTSNEYTDPSDKNSWEMTMGDEINEERDFEEEGDVRLERCCWRIEGGDEVEDEVGVEEESRVTRNAKDCHSRPPDPDDELKSNHKSSHTPNSLGIDTVITGSDKNSAEGDEIVTLWDWVKGQLEQLLTLTFEVHLAFNTSLFSSITSPTLTAKRATGDISKDLSSIHTQRMPLKLNDDCVEGEGHGEGEDDEERDFETLNNFEQFFAISNFIEPPLFVESTNSIKILLPSEENRARFIKGPATESFSPLTTNSEPDENNTS
jgi:hypothetical protein